MISVETENGKTAIFVFLCSALFAMARRKNDRKTFCKICDIVQLLKCFG